MILFIRPAPWREEVLAEWVEHESIFRDTTGYPMEALLHEAYELPFPREAEAKAQKAEKLGTIWYDRCYETQSGAGTKKPARGRL